MKTLPVGMQSHLDSRSTTMVYCWRVTRTDGVIQGFTEHDLDLVFDGTVFEASSGFTATTISTELGLSVDNMNVDGALSSDTITEEDLASGNYDDAAVELFWVNFEDTSQYIVQMKGSIGQVERGEFAFSAETRSLSHRLQQKTGRTFQRYCDADLGDSKCGVDINDSAFSDSGTILSSSSDRVLVVSGLLNDTNSFYAFGKIRFMSGSNSGKSFAIKSHVPGTISLWTKTPQVIAVSDTFTIIAGCGKDARTCKNKFSNLVNFRGFHLIPGNDIVTRYPSRGGADQDGSSIFDKGSYSS